MLSGVAAIHIGGGEVVVPGGRAALAEGLEQGLEDVDRGVVVGDGGECPLARRMLSGVAAIHIGGGQVVAPGGRAVLAEGLEQG